MNPVHRDHSTVITCAQFIYHPIQFHSPAVLRYPHPHPTPPLRLFVAFNLHLKEFWETAAASVLVDQIFSLIQKVARMHCDYDINNKHARSSPRGGHCLIQCPSMCITGTVSPGSTKKQQPRTNDTIVPDLINNQSGCVTVQCSSGV